MEWKIKTTKAIAKIFTVVKSYFHKVNVTFKVTQCYYLFDFVAKLIV